MFEALKKAIKEGKKIILRKLKKIVKGAKKVMEEREAFKTKVYEDTKDVFKKENFVDIGIMILCIGIGIGSGFIIVGNRNK